MKRNKHPKQLWNAEGHTLTVSVTIPNEVFGEILRRVGVVADYGSPYKVTVRPISEWYDACLNKILNEGRLPSRKSVNLDAAISSLREKGKNPYNPKEIVDAGRAEQQLIWATSEPFPTKEVWFIGIQGKFACDIVNKQGLSSLKAGGYKYIFEAVPKGNTHRVFEVTNELITDK